MIAVDEADARIAAQCKPLPQCSIALAQALGGVLTAPVAAERDHPPFDRITHDGVALSTAQIDVRRVFAVQGYAAAGAPQMQLNDSEACIEVATGAMLPLGCDTVVPYEQLHLEAGTAEILARDIAPGQCLHPRGIDAQAGQVLLVRGQRIGPLEVAVLASNGVAEVSVFAAPRLAILATGNELAEISGPVAAHQIRRSNDITLQAALVAHGFAEVRTAWVPDDSVRLEAQLAQWLPQTDLLCITGGVSRGAHDHVPEVLKRLGVREIFHRVAQRPGRPLWFGVAESGALVFGLPGNPASCLTCLVRYVVPALRRMRGKTVLPRAVPLSEPMRGHAELTLFLPVAAEGDAMRVVPTQGSGDFTNLLGSAGFVEIPPRANITRANFYAWEGR